MKITHVPERFPEIDFARGIAVVMMVVFHIAFDLYFLSIVPVPATSLAWRVLAMSTAGLFLFLVGMSLSISAVYARKNLSQKEFILKYVKRGAGIFSIGIGITLVTWIILPGSFILFGILHLIGLAVALSPLYTGYSWQNLVAGLVIILLGPVVAAMRGAGWLLWLGIHPSAFYSIDYTPVVPWLGLVLTGVFFGTLLYPEGIRRYNFVLPEVLDKPFGFLGRHSLAIYLVHQPIILGILFLVSPGTFIPLVPSGSL
ncbi:MAG: DUF1624 domain-containing protein [Methanoregulaceae archaeon]|jgi:uncharacterized membrane protein|nr:DUF1624 domain-containing protein [Methanoregulaceae archaeon]MCU0628218.1 DUF1624 domain-containing protein [Methanoregulaceae archaeon]